jgi:DNA-binding NarL/FixJ family response regulator
VTGKIRVVLADDHPMFRRGLRAVLEESPDIEVVAEADDGEAAIARVDAMRPDVAILDLDMPRKDGVTTAQEIAARRLGARVILLTGHKNDALVRKVLDAGPLGFVLKDGAVTEIVDCVRAVHAGRHYVSPQLSSAVMGRRAEATALATEHAGLASLTPAERRVIGLVAQGKTSKEIADALFISVRTVDHHRAAIADKLGLTGTNALVKFAVANRSALT